MTSLIVLTITGIAGAAAVLAWMMWSGLLGSMSEAATLVVWGGLLLVLCRTLQARSRALAERRSIRETRPAVTPRRAAASARSSRPSGTRETGTGPIRTLPQTSA